MSTESRKKWLFSAIIVVFLLAVFETMAFLTVTKLSSLGAVYDPSLITQDYETYLAKRSETLGWLPRTDGPRPDPGFPDSLPACVSLFGDSFTQSAEVDDGDAWGAVLSKLLRCRVANFGVSAYGSDQAYLRYLALPEQGQIVFLNHLSENILRNSTQFRNFVYPGTEFTFKPRFVFEDDQLRLIGIPKIPPKDLPSFLRDPGIFLKHEYFLPGGPSGIVRSSFPYSLTLLKAMLWNYQIRAKLLGVPRHMEFYRSDHPSRGLQTNWKVTA